MIGFVNYWILKSSKFKEEGKGKNNNGREEE
jgi:hypothetical protein